MVEASLRSISLVSAVSLPTRHQPLTAPLAMHCGMVVDRGKEEKAEMLTKVEWINKRGMQTKALLELRLKTYLL